MSVKVAVFMATGFEEMELTISVDILRRAGARVDMVSLEPELKPVKGSRGIVMLPDTTIDKLDYANLDMIILPGGLEGTKNLGENEKVLALLAAMHKSGKKVAAICAAPAVLVKAGILKSCRATSHPAAAGHMPGVLYSEERVVVDGNITTSRAAGTTFEFAFALVEQLFGKAAVSAVNEGVLARIE